MTHSTPALRRAMAGALLAFAAWSSGCSPLGTEPPRDDSAGSSDSASVLVDSVNYMHTAGVQYTLYDLSTPRPTAVGGAIVYMLASGGEKGSCLNLPRMWRPGMKVRLQWAETDREKTYEQQTREFEIPRYDEPADLHVVFHPHHEVELVVSAAEPGHPDWRGRNKRTPWEQCLAENPRRVCKAATPKLFDIRAGKGACTYMKETNVSDGDNLCDFALGECMRDYEDQPFCDGILWGPIRE